MARQSRPLDHVDRTLRDLPTKQRTVERRRCGDVRAADSKCTTGFIDFSCRATCLKAMPAKIPPQLPRANVDFITSGEAKKVCFTLSYTFISYKVKGGAREAYLDHHWRRQCLA